MATITDEIRDCLRTTGKTQKDLSLASGVPGATICRLLRTPTRDIYARTQDAIRRGIAVLMERHKNAELAAYKYEIMEEHFE